ncbi:MAG: hypothetical protein IT450_14250 [Phycisphaerales bacterium]|nr:hypothetical protein [Phycisphaerales bacterium]
MATKRPSVQKREREQKKRERKLMKAARAAERKASAEGAADASQLDATEARTDIPPPSA